MGVKGGHYGRNMGLGNLTTLRPTTNISTTADNNNNNKPKVPKTRIIRISEQMYRRIVGHAKRYYKDVEPYETILEDLLDCYQKQNTPDYSHFHWNK